MEQDDKKTLPQQYRTRSASSIHPRSPKAFVNVWAARDFYEHGTAPCILEFWKNSGTPMMTVFVNDISFRKAMQP
jgi:hypothetical protein